MRPLRQITGEAEFNEVYMTDVRVPDDHRIGAEGEGWRASLTTLMNERTAIGGGGRPEVAEAAPRRRHRPTTRSRVERARRLRADRPPARTV